MWEHGGSTARARGPVGLRPAGSGRLGVGVGAEADCLSRLCLGRRFCCRCCRNVNEDGTLPTFDLVPSKRPALFPSKFPTSCDPSMCESSDPVPELTSKPCSSKLSTSCSLPNLSSMNYRQTLCGSALRHDHWEFSMQMCEQYV